MQHNRRSFLKLATSTTIASSALGSYAYAARQHRGKKPFILLIHCDGGWDQTLVFDNKIGNAHVAQEAGWVSAQTTGGLQYVANAARPAVTDFFDTHGNKAAIINGLSCDAINHDYARQHALTSSIPGADNRQADYLSIYADQTARAKLFPHLIFDAPLMSGPLSELSVLLNNRLINEHTNAIPNTTPLGASGEQALTTYLNRTYKHMFRRAAYNSVDAKKFWSYYKGYARESALGTALAAGLAGIPADINDTDFSRYGKLALAFFNEELSQCATIRCGAALQWDSHRDNFAQQNAMYEMLFGGVTLILNYAQTLNLYDDLCIVIVSELGRAAQLNAEAGKDHWPYTSCLLWGKGVKSEIAVGVTDNYLRGLKISPTFGTQNTSDAITINSKNVFAALFLKYGVLLDLTLRDVSPLSCVLEA